MLHADTAGMLFSTAYTASIPCYPAAASQAMETPTGCCLLPLHLLLGVTLVALRCLAACWIDVRQLSLEICRSCKQQLRDLWKPATPACNGILIRWGMQLIIGSCSGCQQRAVRQVQCSACQPICLVLQEARGQSKVVLALEDEQQLLPLKQEARAAGMVGNGDAMLCLVVAVCWQGFSCYAAAICRFWQCCLCIAAGPCAWVRLYVAG